MRNVVYISARQTDEILHFITTLKIKGNIVQIKVQSLRCENTASFIKCSNITLANQSTSSKCIAG